MRASEVGPAATAFWRFALALPPLLLWRVLRPPPPAAPHRRSAVLVVIAGLALAGDLALWHWSLRLTTVANATLLSNLAPLFVALGAWLLFRQRPGAGFALGLLAALGGSVLLCRPPSAAVLAPSAAGAALPARLAGDLLGLASAVLYGAYQLAAAQLRRRQSTPAVVGGVAAIGALPLLLVALAMGETLLPRTPAGWSTLAALALGIHLGGYLLITWALAHLSTAFAALALLVQPVVAALLAWWWHGEALAPAQLLGGAIVLAGIWLAGRSGPAAQPPPRPTQMTAIDAASTNSTTPPK